MNAIAQENARKLKAIQKAGITYTCRKYAGAWVPVVIKNGKRHTFTHCSTSLGAMYTAINKAFQMASEQ